jgi:hypothetical protein
MKLMRSNSLKLSSQLPLFLIFALIFPNSIFPSKNLSSEQKNNFNQELIQAVQDGNLEEVEALIEKGADVNVVGEGGMTALAWAVQLDDVAMAELLIEKGADLEKGAKEFKAPLHIAANWGKTEMAELLLAKKANINVRDRNGWTPLHWAAFEGGQKMVMLLVSRGAMKNLQTEKTWSIFEAGSSALDVAERAGDRSIIDLLKRLGCRSGKAHDRPWTYAGYSFETEPGDEDWMDYVKPAELQKKDFDKGVKKEFPINQELPEAVVLYFYAKLMQGDEACQNVVYPGASTEEELQHVKKWTFHKVRLVRKIKSSLTRVWIMLSYDVEFQGDREQGEDEIELFFENNKWWITNIPR